MMNTDKGLKIGERIRTARQKRHLSLRTLATRANVSPSMLSQIENDRAYPSVTTLYNIAEALSLSLNYFFPDADTDDNAVSPRTSDAIVLAHKTASELRTDYTHGMAVVSQPDEKSPVVNPSSRLAIELKGGVRWERLTPSEEKDIQFLEILYRPGTASGDTMSQHSGREFGLILSGTLTLEIGTERYVLNAGDSIIFDSNTPHRLSNLSNEVMRAVWIVMNRG